MLKQKLTFFERLKLGSAASDVQWLLDVDCKLDKELSASSLRSNCSPLLAQTLEFYGDEERVFISVRRVVTFYDKGIDYSAVLNMEADRFSRGLSPIVKSGVDVFIRSRDAARRNNRFGKLVSASLALEEFSHWPQSFVHYIVSAH